MENNIPNILKLREYINFLLENASPNIQYRVKKEILKEQIDTPEMLSLQSQILTLPKVKKAFACQRENGFFGSVLHGVYFDGFDSTVELLKKNGVELTDSHMIKAKKSLIDWKDYEKDHFYQAGNAMDEHFVDSISSEQFRTFKKYASIAPSWQKKESIACDLYFPILLALSKEGAI